MRVREATPRTSSSQYNIDEHLSRQAAPAIEAEAHYFFLACFWIETRLSLPHPARECGRRCSGSQGAEAYQQQQWDHDVSSPTDEQEV